MIEIKNLNKTYDRARHSDTRVLKDVSFSLPDTGFVCILGPSGCGKTSLLNAIGGLDTFDNGVLKTDSAQVSRYGTLAYEEERNRNFGYIFQNYYLLSNHSVAYNVYLGLHSLDLSHREKLKRVRQALEAVDMDRYIRRKVSELSGGQQQRVAIARALARRPRVIFADEPTGNLDEANTHNICSLLRKVSKDSLVVMVTHEEPIARFYADRIITLNQGEIAEDVTEWDRHKSLHPESDKILYTGDYTEARHENDAVDLRLLHSDDAEPIKLTVIATKDRIILKLNDNRTVTLSEQDNLPEIVEGARPVLTPESVDHTESVSTPLFDAPPAAQAKAGKGVTASMMLSESRMLMAGRGIKRIGMRIFLILLTVVALYMTADYITVSSVNPEDFITTDSHILTVSLEAGENTPSGSPPTGYTWQEYHYGLYRENLINSGLDFDFIPKFNNPPEYSMTLFYQQDLVTMKLPAFSHVLIDRLDPSTLIYGRMPENSEEIVVDRILLEAMLASDGIIQNSVLDISLFISEKLTYNKMSPTIVGISDSGERALYLTEAAMCTVSSRGARVITLSELKARFPGVYDHLTLSGNERIPNTAQAGAIWDYRIGQLYGSSYDQFYVADTVNIPEVAAHYIVADGTVNGLIAETLSGDFTIYCADKAAVKEFLAETTEMEENGYLIVSVSDPYEETYRVYAEAASIRADARTIVTFTILFICLVMLYLLCRVQVQERLGLVAVYRLLGIPKRKLHGIFLLEATLSALWTIVSTAIFTSVVIFVLKKIPELAISLLLPWQAVVCVSGVLLLYYALVSVLPLARLLRLPPAQLAAKYDM